MVRPLLVGVEGKEPEDNLMAYQIHQSPTASPTERTEDRLTRTIETQTVRIPSNAFLWFAIGSMATSLTFQMMGRKESANFIGLWAPTILIMGLYNKLVKVAGHDQATSSFSPY